MHCQKCGSNIDLSDTYCWKCGAAVVQARPNLSVQIIPLNLRVLNIASFIFASLLSIRFFLIIAVYERRFLSGNAPQITDLIFGIAAFILSIISIVSIFKVNLRKIYLFSIGFIITFFLSRYQYFFLTRYKYPLFNYIFFIILLIIALVLLAILFVIVIKSRQNFIITGNNNDIQDSSLFIQRPIFFYTFGSITYVIFIVYHFYLFIRFVKITISYIGSRGMGDILSVIMGIIINLFILFFIIYNYRDIFRNSYFYSNLSSLLLAGLILGRLSGILSLAPTFFRYFYKDISAGIPAIFILFFLVWLVGIFGNKYLKRLYFRNF